jgi:mannose-6-phosphate isomerase-like protein (cupin superfamily)
MSLETCRVSSSLERHRLDHFTKGWFVGTFHPTLIPTDAVEVAIKHYKAGDHEPAHHHKIATELTAVVSGRVRMCGEEIGAGEIVKIHPGQSTDFTALTDTITVVVKMPCVAGDKYADAVGT